MTERFIRIERTYIVNLDTTPYVINHVKILSKMTAVPGHENVVGLMFLPRNMRYHSLMAKLISITFISINNMQNVILYFLAKKT